MDNWPWERLRSHGSAVCCVCFTFFPTDRKGSGSYINLGYISSVHLMYGLSPCEPPSYSNFHCVLIWEQESSWNKHSGNFQKSSIFLPLYEDKELLCLWLLLSVVRQEASLWARLWRGYFRLREVGRATFTAASSRRLWSWTYDRGEWAEH